MDTKQKEIKNELMLRGIIGGGVIKYFDNNEIMTKTEFNLMITKIQEQLKNVN